jgi:hypothetical protein
VSLAQVSLAQDNDDDMDPISESLLSSGTRRRVMLSSTNPFDDDEGSTAEIVDPVQSNDEAPNALKSSTAARTEAQYAAGRKAFECVPTPLPDVQATPLRSMIQKQYPAFRIPEEDEYSQYGQAVRRSMAMVQDRLRWTLRQPNSALPPAGDVQLCDVASPADTITD